VWILSKKSIPNNIDIKYDVRIYSKARKPYLLPTFHLIYIGSLVLSSIRIVENSIMDIEAFWLDLNFLS